MSASSRNTSALHVSSWLATTINFESKIHMLNKSTKNSLKKHICLLTKVLICIFNLLLDDKHQMLIENTERHFGAQISEVILRLVFPYLKLYC
ncbi:hypothetical protein Patl1_32297 [Pistacia atlantica]|uniref:Uncharacterized protein n=1 Tax=Pistacia atlantica TaxID=434234 RepID=A0ACC1ALY8_9ROSI|nr:hypothetical protein Patl1_32297 [Pistacia atlantica]